MGRGEGVYNAKLKGVLILIYSVRPGLHCYKGQGLQAYANSHINMRKSTPICENSEKYAK